LPKKILTIITVVKNCVDTIGLTLDSLLLVKDQDVEFIVIDGASGDGTLNVLQRYSSIIDQLCSEPDTGIYNAMNKGVSKAHGSYILFINGDDQIQPDGFRFVLSVLRTAKAGIVCATTIAPKTDEVLIPKPHHLFFHNSIPHPSAFVRAEYLRAYPFREDLKIAADYDFFLYFYLRRCKFLILPVVSAIHTRGGASSDTLTTLNELALVRRKQLGAMYQAVNLVDLALRTLKYLFRKISSGFTTL